MIRSPKVLICASLLLFLFLALLVPWKDVYRFFFFAGVMPGVIWAFSRGDRPAGLYEPAVKILMILILYLSLNSFLVSDASFKDSFDRLRWGIEILFLLTGILFASELWMKRPRFYGFLFLGAVLVSGISVLLPYLLAGRFDTRLEGFGFLGHPIQAASILLVLWAIGVALMSFAPTLRFIDRAILLLSGLVVVGVAVYSQSRGPMIASVITVLSMTVSWFAVTNKPWNLILLVLLTAFGFLGVFWALLPGQYTGWFLEMMTNRGLSYRPEIWSSVLQHASSHWLFGVGAATDFVDTGAGAALKSELGLVFVHTHNIFIELFLVGGVVALGLLLGAMYLMLMRVSQSTCSVGSKLVGASILLVLVMVNFTDTARPLSSPSPDWVLLWLPLGFLLSLAFRLRAAHPVAVERQ